ncbi:hypothetical protein PBRA_001437 [Plasmodiophora brassicae]|uniref:ubiquitinyl hydrolase 1 n=1 Tax=Plasmodiophora brassicae TaxID=37360 RepID=A0A0G4IYE7_PLABS|nr:hypothetical protein PBRA_001437 [Plasmodiophora brassicae]
MTDGMAAADDRQSAEGGSVEDGAAVPGRQQKLASMHQAGNDAFRNGEYARAVELFSAALDHADRDRLVVLLRNRGMSRLRMSQPVEADQDFSRAIEVDPKNPKSYFNRGRAREVMGRFADAKDDYATSFKLGNSALAQESYNRLCGEPSSEITDRDFYGTVSSRLQYATVDVSSPLTLPIVNGAWWAQFELLSKADYDGSPGPVDNAALLDSDESRDRDSGSPDTGDMKSAGDAVHQTLAPFDDGLSVRPGIRKQDYVIVTDEVWDMLMKRFGGGPCVRRHVIAPSGDDGLSTWQPVVKLDCELYPTTLFAKSTDKPVVVFTCSALHTVRSILQALCSVWVATATEVRAVHLGRLLPVDVTLRELGFANGDSIAIERRLPTGLWPPSVCPLSPRGEADSCDACYQRIVAGARVFRCARCSLVRYCSSGCLQSHRPYHMEQSCGKLTVVRQRAPGTVGIRNIGNSCYVNAALQCLSNCWEISRPFLSDSFRLELNCDNPLGCQGRLAAAYACLLKEMWFGPHDVVDAREFKSTLAAHATQFAGTQQHDAQEFLAFLLDGLHEDLNRIHSKPYIPITDSNGRPDELVAAEQWTNYLARNQSIIVDYLCGQFKSELVCPNGTCPPSVKFDAFTCVSLPLPEAMSPRTVIYCPRSGARPTKLTIAVPSKVTPSTLERCLLPTLLSRRDYTQGNPLVMAYFAQSHPLIMMPENGQPPNRDQGSLMLAAFEIRPGTAPLSCIIRQISMRGDQMLFRGRPFVIDIPQDRNVLGSALYDSVRTMLARGSESGKASASPWRIELLIPSEQRIMGIEDADSVVHVAPDAILSVTAETAHLLYFDMGEFNAIDDAEAGEEGSDSNLDLPSGERPVTIGDCLREFTRVESLGINDWRCPACHKLGSASKRISLYRLPDILVLHLKRFDSIRQHFLFGNTPNKISKKVEFPLRDLDLDGFVSWSDGQLPVRYELFSVINHHGASFFGHYTAFCKGLDGAWRLFDDDVVRVVESEEICTKDAYVLFYRRQAN